MGKAQGEGRWPLVKLALALLGLNQAIKNSKSVEPILHDFYFDKQNVVDPYHIMKGIGEKVIEAIFLQVTRFLISHICMSDSAKLLSSCK